MNWNETSLNCNTPYTYRVKARNGEVVETNWTSLGSQTTTACDKNVANRILPAFYAPGVPLIVSITVTPNTGTNNYAVEDSTPIGWVSSNISHGGLWSSSENKVKWGPFFDNNPRTLTFKATPPAGETAIKTFNGTASFNGNNIPITGDTSISLALLHQSDTSRDYRIVIDEITAYGAAWKKGQSWATLPKPIPIEYVTNAGYIWKTAELYHYDPSLNPPWAPGAFLKASLQFKSLGTNLSSRELGNDYAPLVPQPITITVTPDSRVAVYAVEDIPPAGWVVNDVNEGGVWDDINKKVKWGPFFDNIARTLSYTATPPAGETGAKIFIGISSFDGSNQPITGEATTTNNFTIYLPLIKRN